MTPRRAAVALAVAAALARGALALVTEVKPIFPAYYYTDAELMHARGAAVAEAWSRGERPALPGSPSQRVQALLIGSIYRVAGPRPMAAKLVNAAVGGVGVWLLFETALPIFGTGPAVLAAAVLAAWPSHAFYTSQNFKDAWVLLFLLGGWAALGRLLQREKPAPAWGVLALGLLLGLGLWRQSLMYATCAGAAAAGLAALLRRGTAGPALALAAALAAAALFRPAARVLFLGPLSVDDRADVAAQQLRLLPPADPDRDAHLTPYSPEGLSLLRRRRLENDRAWAQQHRGRSIGTQLFPDLEFRGWLDVLLFLPKGVFWVLFMPLPFLYPMDGNVGRLLASVENLALLALAAAAALGAARGPKTAGRLAVLLFAAVMAAGSALVEFDLGSVSRHRLQYLCLILPFAFSPRPPRRPGAGRRRVAQVIECGGPGGTGNQVAAICNALDAERFETTLVYAVREGDPEAYRASARGAVRAHHVPEMTREISPLRDLRAFLRLYRIFKDERPDVVHAHSSKAGALARPAAWLAGVPLIYYSPHGYGFLQADRSAASRLLYKAAEAALSWIGAVVAVSPSEAALAAPLAWGKPVETVTDPYLGALPAPARKESGALVVGACGRLTAARRPEAFARLAHALTAARPGLRCVWIGGGELESALAGKVEVTGWLESAEARRRLQGLDVFVHYSAWDALPNAVLEAMACALPVVASAAPGCRDAVADGETGFIAKDEKELLERCLALVDGPELRRRLGAAGRLRIEKAFSQAAAVERLSALYGAI